MTQTFLHSYTGLPNLYATLVADTGTKSLGTKSREVTVVIEEWGVTIVASIFLLFVSVLKVIPYILLDCSREE